MNSLMQQLYMTPTFRYGILTRDTMSLAAHKQIVLRERQAKDPLKPLHIPERPEYIATVIKGMQDMFAFLQQSKLKYWNSRPVYSYIFSRRLSD